MTSIRVTHGLDDLYRDLARIPPAFYREGRKIVSEGARVGNSLAKDNARRSSGTHARLYPRAFTADRAHAYTGPVGKIIADYGPEPRGQGLLAPILENGSRNNPPHGDLRRSADVIGPALHGETRRMLDGFFWPGGDR